MPAPQIQGSATTTQNVTAATSSTISKPAGAAVDEYLFVIYRFAIQTATFSDQQGFTEVTHANASGANRQYILYKKVDGTEGSSFTFTHSSSAYGAIMFRVSGVHLTTPIDDSNGLAQATTGTTITLPSLTTTGPVRMLLWAAGALAVTTVDWTPDNLDTNEITELQITGNSTFAVTREEQTTAGASGTRTATFGASSTGQNAVCCAIIPSDESVPETMRPNTNTGGVATNLNGGTYNYTVIDDDPDNGGTDFLTGTDPSGSSGSSNTNYADAQTTASGIANQLTNPANAVGSSEASTSATTGATQNADYANFFTFDETALASAIPSNATITGVTVRLRDALSTLARGDVGVRVDSTNGTQIEAEDTAKTGLGTALPAAGTGAHTYAMSTLPTRAQLIASSFGVRVRYRRTASQAATYTLDWIRLEITYTTPGSTVNTEVRAPLSDPTSNLATGAASGEIRAQVRKLGSGSNPSVRLEVRNAAGSLLATALSDTTISTTATAGQVVSGTFDQSAISNPTDVVIWIVGTGAAGGLLEVGAVEWNAKTSAQATAGNTRVVAYDVQALAGNTRQALFNISSLSGNTRALSFDIRALAGVSRQVLYDLRAPAGNTRVISYNISGRSGNTRAIAYDVLTKAGNTRALSFDVRALAGQSRIVAYDVRALSGNARQIRFDVYSRAGNTRQILYDVLQAALLAGNSRSILYDLRAPVGNTRPILFNISSLVGNTRPILFNISGRSGNARSILYDVRGLATAPRVVVYDVRALTGNSRAISYNLASLVSNTRQVRFDILGRAGNTRAIAYDLRALAGQGRQILFNISGRSGNTRAILFNVSGLSGNGRTVLYNISGRSGNTRQILYDLLTNALVVGNSRQIRYDLRALAGAPRPILYDVYNRSGNPRQVRYDVLTMVGNSRVLRYDLRALAGSPRTILYDLRGFASAPRSILFDVSGRSGNTRQIRYAINTLVGNQRTILFDIESMVVEVYLLQIAMLHAAELEGIPIQPARLETLIREAHDLEAEAVAAGASAPAVIKGSRLQPETWAIS